MSEVYSNITFDMPSDQDYQIIEPIFKNVLDKPDIWPVEEYNSSFRMITLEETNALKEDVIGLAKVINSALERIATANKQENPDAYKKLQNISFTMDCYTSYSNCGEEENYVIVKDGPKMTIQESQNAEYYSDCYFSDDYEDFCEELEGMCPDIRKLIPEDKWSPDHEFYVTDDGNVYIDEEPPLGTPYPLSECVLYAGGGNREVGVYGEDDEDAE